MVARGLLNEASYASFIVCCQTYQDLQEWTARLPRITLESDRRGPAEERINKLRTQYRQQAAEFGLTPARAAGVKAVKPASAPAGFARLVGGRPVP